MTKKELDFIYNSNMIEGIEFPREYYSDNMKYNPDEVFISPPEIEGHKKAFEYMKERSKIKLPNEQDILAMHKLLIKGLVNEKYVGAYRDVPVYIGGRAGILAIAIKGEMRYLMDMCKKAKEINEIWDCHHEFEVIHPFIDGNGRTGRLLLNWLMLFNKHKLTIVNVDKRLDYYNTIEAYQLTRGDKKRWEQN